MSTQVIKYLLVFYALLGLQQLAICQEDFMVESSELSEHTFSVSYNRGNLLPHHDLINYYKTSGTNALFFSAEKKIDKDWANNFSYVSRGIEAYTTSLSNNELLGRAVHLSGYTSLGIHSKAKGRIKIAAGIAVISEKFSFPDNYKNVVIGSYFNYNISLEYSYMFSVAKRLYLTPYIRLTHYSNAASRMPNLGLNVASLGLAIQKSYLNLSTTSSKLMRIPAQARLDLAFTYGRSEQLGLFNPQMANFGLNLQYLKRKTKLSYGLGLDLHYSGSHYLRGLEEKGESDQLNSFRTGISLPLGLILGKSQIRLDIGVYVIDQLKLDSSIYNRFYFQTQVAKGLDVRLGLKSHITRAETAEIGLVKTLFSK